MSRTAAVRFAAFLRQPCDKAHGYLAVVLRLSQDKCVAGELLRQSYEQLACLAAVLRQPCVSCGCRTSFRKCKQFAKKMNMSKIRCRSLATLFLYGSLAVLFTTPGGCRTKARNLSSQIGARLSQG